MAEEHKGDDTLRDEETRKNNRMILREVSNDMADSKQEMKNVHSSKFANMLKRYENMVQSLVDPNTRELISRVECLRKLTDAVKGQARILSDVSSRLSWKDLSVCYTKRFFNEGATGGLDWGRLGSEARQVFNTTPSFTTLVGPIHKEERVRKIVVRRLRENTAGVVLATSENVENNESDGNDEAFNARIVTLLEHLDSYHGQEFDLLKTLVDPVNPVQSVENFFDYSYLHKEKRVQHKYDSNTGTLKASAADPIKLERAPKTQMVLSFNMQDMKTLTQILYPEGHDGCSSSEGTTGTDTLRVAHPLHREDPLYDAQDAQEQVRILAERTAQQKAQQASKTTSSNTGKQRAASRLTRVVEARIDRGSQQAAARSHTPVIAAVHSSRSPYKAGRSSRSSGILDHNVPQSNGNSSSRQSCASTTAANGTPSPTRAFVRTPDTACSSGTAASVITASPAVTPSANIHSGSVSAHRASTPGSTFSTNTATSASTVNPPYTPVKHAAARRVGTPGTAGTASSSLTAASMSPATSTANRRISTETNRASSGKRALNLEDSLEDTDSLTQGPAKRRLAEPFSASERDTPSTVGRGNRSTKARGDEDKEIRHTGQNGPIRKHLRGRRNDVNSPASVQSERTENMFVSAFDGDSGNSY